MSLDIFEKQAIGKKKVKEDTKIKAMKQIKRNLQGEKASKIHHLCNRSPQCR